VWGFGGNSQSFSAFIGIALGNRRSSSSSSPPPFTRDDRDARVCALEQVKLGPTIQNIYQKSVLKFKIASKIKTQ